MATLIYSQMRFVNFIRVGKTAVLWSLNSTLVAIAIFWFTLKIPLGRFSKPVFLTIHLLAAVIISGIYVGLAFLSLHIYSDPVIVDFLKRMYPQLFQIGITGYVALAGWFYFLQYQKHSKEQAIREANLEKLSKEAELKALKTQINPHFLFNTLNSLNALVLKDPKRTREIITRLGNMLRYVLEGSESSTVSLAQELEFIKDYLTIEKARFGEKLKFFINVDKNLEEVQLPPIILQPLVENAIKHGVARQSAGGWIKINIRADRGNLTCQVIDNCGKLASPDKNLGLKVNRGLGLRNIRERLRYIFNDDFSLTIENNTPLGVTATVVFPVSPKRD
jgi:sensor histidine kinase YesM